MRGATAAAGASALLVVVLGACTADAPPTKDPGTHVVPPSSSPRTPDAEPAAPERVLDPLTITLVLGTPRGNRLPARIRVENRTGHTVTDPGCRTSNYQFGVVRASDPGASFLGLVGQVMTSCTGKRELPDGSSETSSALRFNLRGLGPGDYLATVDFGDSRSERLTAAFTIPAP